MSFFIGLFVFFFIMYLIFSNMGRILRYLLGKAVRQSMKKTDTTEKNSNPSSHSAPQESSTNQTKDEVIPSGEGDYIDFEEVKDTDRK